MTDYWLYTSMKEKLRMSVCWGDILYPTTNGGMQKMEAQSEHVHIA